VACPVAHDCIAYAHNLIAKLPAPRPAKQLPQRETRFAVMLDGAAVLLQKRPAPGIWGGMWCFPETDAGTFAAAALRFGAEVGDGFTHFRLRIHPMLMRVRRRTSFASEAGIAWVDIEAALSYAIPVPVRSLLRLLRSRIDGLELPSY
jgi:A/G-specific adenine glycosylase